MATSRSRSRTAKSAVAGGLLLAAAGATLVFAPWADAHHSEATVADYECAPDGGYLVSWSVYSWSQDADGNHPAVQATYVLDGAAPVVVPSDDSAYPASDASGTAIQGIGRFIDGDKDFGGVIEVPYTGVERTIQIIPTTLSVAPQDLYYPDGDDADDLPDVIPAGGEVLWNIWTKVTGGDLPSVVETLPAESCASTTTTVPETTTTTVPETTTTTEPETTTTTTEPETTTTTAPETTTSTTAEVSSSSTTPSTAPPTEVAGARQTRTPGSLPRTGTESNPLAAIGLGLLATGVTIVAVADRRRRAAG